MFTEQTVWLNAAMIGSKQRSALRNLKIRSWRIQRTHNQKHRGPRTILTRHSRKWSGPVTGLSWLGLILELNIDSNVLLTGCLHFVTFCCVFCGRVKNIHDCNGNVDCNLFGLEGLAWRWLLAAVCRDLIGDRYAKICARSFLCLDDKWATQRTCFVVFLKCASQRPCCFPPLAWLFQPLSCFRNDACWIIV